MILRNIVTEQSEIKKILKILCQNKPTLCKKQSTSGLTSNQRVIVVRGQNFQFYNKPPKFKEGQLASLGQKYLKAQVQLGYIYQLSFLPQNVTQKKSLMLTIPLNKISAKNIQLYKESVIKSTGQKQKQQNYIISWLFTFDQDVKSKIFKLMEDQQKKQKEKLLNVVKYDPQSDLAESILNMSKDKITERNVSDRDPVKDLHKNIQKLKNIKQQMEFQQRIQKKQQQRQKAIKLSMSLRRNQKGQGNQQVLEQQQIYSIKFAWRQYWKIYEKASKLIGQPISIEYIQKQLQLLNEVFKLQGQIKEIATEYINFKMIGWNPDKIIFEDFQMYKGIWIKLGGKQLNQQFLSNYYLSDLMYVVKQYNKFKFRIPPMFFINYKTIKAICMIDQPFSTIKPLMKQIYNIQALKSEMDYQLMNKIKEGLQFFQRILNIKNQLYINGNYQTTAPLGLIKVFEYDNKFEQNSTNFLQNFYYVIGVKGQFPVDYQFQTQKYQPQYCLRPQIIAQYRDYMQSNYRQDNQLLTQAFLHSKITLQVKGKQDAKVVEVSKQFLPLKIKKLMHQFNQINLILIDSYSIKRYMSQMGINVRYLGFMYKHTQIPYIKQTLQIQMLSRTIKSIYCQSIKDLITNQIFFKRQLYLKKHKDIIKQNMRIHHQLMSQNAIDFLNLVFGVGQQTDAFWKILIEKCRIKYGHKFQYPVKVKYGCLLHAVIWHCGLIINFDIDIKLFQIQKPFDMKNWHDFRVETKSFQYPSLEINKIIKRLSTIDYLKQVDQISKYAFSFLKLQLLRNHNTFGLGLKTQVTLSRINNMRPQLQKPFRQCSLHPSQLPFYFSNKTQYNFKKAMDIINFSLASNHPLFISLYDAYSQQFEPKLLKKSALLAAMKGLGQFHPRTTELYSKYYRQGFQQFQIKAKRSSQTEAALTISQQLFSKRKFQSCLHFCYNRIQIRQKQKSNASGQDLSMYIQILKYGLISAVKTRFYEKGLVIAQQFSQMINTYKIRSHEEHQLLLYHALLIQLNLTSQKFYIYKIVLLVVHIQKQFQKNLATDSQNFILPRSAQQKSKIILGIINEYYLQQTHSKWIEHIFNSLRRGYLYFNYLNDLFNNYQYHIKNYNMQQFSDALGYLDVLVRYFGQKIFHDNLYKINN